MHFREEDFARDFHADVTESLRTQGIDAAATLEGMGVHWHCTTILHDRTCTTHCFDYGTVGGPEYLVYFVQEGQRITQGRTCSQAEAVSSVLCWLDGASLSELWKRFAFVDRTKRGLQAIERAVLDQLPSLNQQACHELRVWDAGGEYLWIGTPTRSCQVSYYFRNELPDASLRWDDCELIRIQQATLDQLIPPLRRWLCDNTCPSVMKSEFPWIEMDPVARRYEQGRPIEGEFIESWNRVEELFRSLKHPNLDVVIAIMAKMRKAGYDRLLRAGQTLYSLGLSRSRRHGLRQGQACIFFDFKQQGMNVHLCFDRHETLKLTEIDFTTEVDELLKRLVAIKID